MKEAVEEVLQALLSPSDQVEAIATAPASVELEAEDELELADELESDAENES
ncbi:MAG: hypothetical protein M3430_19190 [Acidobacteriota bacterium]|nr:hypothetical protein [Acidobacteriota bacterium]